MIKAILDELNLENGSNFKKGVLTKHKDNMLLQRVLKMALDKVQHTYGVTMKNVQYTPEKGSGNTLEQALDFLENELCTRNITGNNAIEALKFNLEFLSKDDANVIERIIGRDLKIRLGRTEINKVFKDLITKPPYMRCDIGTEANVSKLNFKEGVYSQLKADGTYRSAIREVDSTTFMSRPGIEEEFPVLKAEFDSLNLDGEYAFLGELTVEGIADRSEGNGRINSLTPPHESIYMDVWDMIPLEEYRTKNGKSNYEDRFNKLKETIKDCKHIRIIEHKVVYSMKEAFEHFQEITERGLEGTVIKSRKMKWKDGTSKEQLKVKLVIELDMRITGFTPGTGKNENYFGAMTFENDEGTIKGRVGVSSMTEKERDEIDANREQYIGQVMEVHCNDITKARGNDYHALSHPRFFEMRGKEKETDTLDRALEQKQMAMERYSK